MQQSSTDKHKGTDPQLDKLRTLILGKDNSLVKDSIKKDARKIVSDVVSEALHDRQNDDGSIDKVLQPIVEESVQQSVEHNKDKLVSALYPLVGSLVRKSVSAFLANFVEKTNELLENSFTYKGLKWRIKAWQAGISFAQYAAAQTFVYRVEHVFLIHRETGILLKSLDINATGKQDADLISSMLTAINDFVGDSFLSEDEREKEQLQSVSTDNFNLLIKPGPSAIIVAAVIGTPPQQLNDQLQLTLENIHRLYIEELTNFNGDNLPFDNTENSLQDCLLSEQKSNEDNKKKPILAWLLLVVFFSFSLYQFIGWYQGKQMVAKLNKLEPPPGILINQISLTSQQKIEISALRDPNAINISEWLNSNNILSKNIKITEYAYQSLAPEILYIKAKNILQNYPGIKVDWNEQTLFLTGQLDIVKKEQLLQQLNIAGYSVGSNLNTKELQTISLKTTTIDREVKLQLFNELIGRISAIQLDFTVESEVVTTDMQEVIHTLYGYLQQLEEIAQELNINYGLLVLGSSDSSGTASANVKLSIARARNTATIIENMGFSKNKIYVTGLGQIDIATVNNAARKVMFNIIFVKQVNPETN